MPTLTTSALAADSETSSIEFKDSFDPKSGQAWCEIIKDLVAIANSGGGAIVFGLDSKGQPTGDDVSDLLNLDPADITNKIYRYTGFQFSDFNIERCEKQNNFLATVTIGPTSNPIVFEKPGTYDIGGGKQKTAFGAGSIYFRHGAKSEPGNSEDLRQFFERKLEIVRESWLGNIRQVFEAPLGSTVITVQPGTETAALAFRLTDDPSAPTIGGINPDTTHPYRQKELIEVVNNSLSPGIKINQYDILCLRKLYNIGANPSFHYLPKFGGHQYSQAYADWLIEKCREDNQFFLKARKIMHDNRAKPQTQ
jgi:hypothetical protein